MPGTAEITRVIKGDATATVNAKQAEEFKKVLGYDYTISMDGDGKPSVAFSGMQVEYTADVIFTEIPGSGEHIAQIDVNADGENITLDHVSGSTTVTVSGQTVSTPFTPFTQPGGWDDQIWKPWESPKTLK
jgi:hypothetical protein